LEPAHQFEGGGKTDQWRKGPKRTEYCAQMQGGIIRRETKRGAKLGFIPFKKKGLNFAHHGCGTGECKEMHFMVTTPVKPAQRNLSNQVKNWATQDAKSTGRIRPWGLKRKNRHGTNMDGDSRGAYGGDSANA